MILQPNPASASVRVILPLKHNTANISITDASGKTVMNQLMNNTTSGVYIVNIESFAAGVYYIKAIADGQTYVEKLVKK